LKAEKTRRILSSTESLERTPEPLDNQQCPVLLFFHSHY